MTIAPSLASRQGPLPTLSTGRLLVRLAAAMGIVPFRMDLESRPKSFPGRLRLLLKTITMGLMNVQRRSPVHRARPLVSLPVSILSFYRLT